MKSMTEEKVSRRGFLQSGAAALGILSLSQVQLAGSAEKSAKGKIPIGLQLYSVRKDCEKDFPGTVAAVAKIGYAGVEFAGYYGRTAAEVRKVLDDNGLKCCGTHAQFDTLIGDELAKTVEFNMTIGNKYLICPWIPEEKRKTKQDWLDVAKLFNDISAKVKPHGMQVGYHNHNFEFTPIDGEKPWDIFFGNTDPSVIMQVDTGNGLGAGQDMIPFLRKYPGRAVTIHIKEFSAKNPNAVIGEGDIDWKEVFSICETTGGTQWYIVEDEKENLPALECVKKNLENLRKMGK
jgi:sugar phosphate isomerase/epimerase